jgi:hypothetical protein
VLAAGFQRAFEDEVLDEVRDHAVLALGGDDDQAFATGLGGFGGHQLDSGSIDDREQLLGHGLRGRQESRPQTGCWNDRRTRDRHLGPSRHRSHHNVIPGLRPVEAGKSSKVVRLDVMVCSCSG